MSIKIYHWVPKNLTGDWLYPLNRLLEVYPDIGEAQKAKYEGREVIMQKRIPAHNWLWNDVLHFSPVHPKKINNALLAAGAKPHAHYFEIDPEQLGFNSDNSVIYLSNKKSFSPEFEAAEFEAYSIDNIAKHIELPEWTKAYYERMISQNKRPLRYAGVPHILHKEALRIEDLKIIEV